MCGGRKSLVVIIIVLLCVLQGLLVGYYTVSDDSYKDQVSRSKANPITKSHDPKASTLLPQVSINHPKSPPTSEKPQYHPLSAGESTPSCSDSVCVSLLQRPSQYCYTLCEQLAFIETRVPPSTLPKRCKFINGTDRDPVALVSVPGSGNTWVRGLLEKATGVCTGSIYCDYPLRNEGFIGELVHDGGVLVIKTHTSDFQWAGMMLEKRNIDDAFYGSAIFLIRNPFDTFVAERHRSSLLRKGDLNEKDGSHVYSINKTEFGK